MTTTAKQKPRFVLRPSFDAGLTTVYAFFATLVCTAVIPLLLGTFIYVLFTFLGLAAYVSPGLVFGALLVGCIAFTPPIFFEIRKRALKRTFFAFYDGHLDFQYWHFYLQPRRGRVQYRDIDDVYQQAGTLQAQRMLTSLFIYIPRFGQRGMAAQGGFSGLIVPDLRLAANDMTKVVSLLENPEAAQLAAG
jgi:hypothetical protein